MRDEIVGPGVDRFAIASDERKLDKHQQHAPLVFCLVKRIDGKITTFSDLERTEETFQKQCLPKDEYNAFRWAAGWEVKGRWEAFQHGVFKNVIRDFKDQHQIQQWAEGDLLPPTTRAKAQLFAWRLSRHWERRLREWLMTRQACPKVEQVRSSVAPELRKEFDNAVAGVCRQSPSPPPNQAASEGFTPLQLQMLNAALESDEWKSCLKNLDPSRWNDYRWIENKYYDQLHWMSAGDEILFGHDSISARFRHGQHNKQPVEQSIQELADGPDWVDSMPALVAVRLQGDIIVIFGNRRLYCCKEAYKLRRSDLHMKIIIHEFPSCHSIEDQGLRNVFKLRAIQAASTKCRGRDVKLNQRKRPCGW